MQHKKMRMRKIWNAILEVFGLRYYFQPNKIDSLTYLNEK